MRAAVAGASGYAGGELLRLLLSHPRLSIGPLAAGNRAGDRLGAVHPQLASIGDIVLGDATAEHLADSDIVFLALPHGQSAALAKQLPADLPIVDLGADFRLADGEDWTNFYGGDHAGTWTYGLPELAYPDGTRGRDHVREARRVANPGCYPTSIITGLAPLLAAGLIEPVDIVVVAASGTSGAGRKAAESLLGSEVMGSMSAYKVGGVHQHTPEIEQALADACGESVTIGFTPMLAPMSRGILASSSAHLSEGATAELLYEALRAAYVEEEFVIVLPPDQWPVTSSTYGANTVHLQVTADERTGRAIVVSAMDNLVKGAAGQALQNANIMLGFAESAGLTTVGVAP